MKPLLAIFVLLPVACSLTATNADVERYKEQAARVTIIRDLWGIPHIYGKTDADAVFGLLYAQCELSFERVERAYIEKLGRLSEIEGESRLPDDLRSRLIYDTAAAKADYEESPAWLKKLLQAFADGINYYLYKNPGVKPALLKHFEPWFPLLFTDGGYTAMQAGGLQTEDIKRLYFPNATNSSSGLVKNRPATEPTGSNAFAIGPLKSASKNALLYINPHVSFYFRTEVHMVSEEGLNAYGAVTWGQFFVFQGFNEHCGWMHTSSMADAADLYEERTIKKGDSIFYEYDGELKAVTQKQQAFQYKSNNGLSRFSITTYHTHHGPVAGMRNGMWLSLKEQNRSLKGLIQSWQRTKAKDYGGFERTMQWQANVSTNTMYADDKGTIAYWHGNFIPERDQNFNWALPVDGSTSSTEWKGVHSMSETIHIYNPAQGWLQNCNSTPFSASGFNSIPKNRYPAYMAPDGENFRSLLAIKEIEKENSFTPDKLIALGYNRYLVLFDSLLPPLFQAYDALPPTDSFKLLIKEPIDMLRAWNRRSSVSSVATTLAIEWAYNLIYTNYYAMTTEAASDHVQLFTSFANNTPPRKRVAMLAAVVQAFETGYGTWKVPWGELNRYQRTDGSMQEGFDDAKLSIPVGMASALFGSLPAYEKVWYQTKKGYGVAGNSFVAVVEFGKKIKAKAIVPGGSSFDPSSKHFNDQTQMYLQGSFRDVLFYREEVEKGAERIYHPGEALK
jgi:acyl-homoserine-lactone acylase